jgi:hypothetical protein
LHGNRVVIGGQSFYQSNPGRVYVFDHDGSSWGESAKLELDMPAFARSVAVEDSTLVASSFQWSTGISYVFRERPWGWDLLTTVENPNGSLDEWTNGAVAISGETVLAGFEEDDTFGKKAGIARAVRVPPDVGATYCTSVPNSTGLAAELVLNGSSEVQDDCFHAYGFGLPPANFAAVFASLGTDNLPMYGGGQGTLCLATPFYRLPGSALRTSVSGTYLALLELAAVGPPPGPQPGETWHFQAWYRDGVGAASTTNLTSAVAITVQ